jgi:hypothetical protein
MRLILSLLFLVMVVSCIQLTPEPIVEPPDGPVIVFPPDPEPPPTHNLVVVFNTVYSNFAVYEDGYMCWHTNPVVEPVAVIDNKAYYLLDSEVYCLSWVDTRKPWFTWTLNGEQVSGPIYSAKIIDSPEDLRSYDIR